MTDWKKQADEIIESLGGSDNITHLEHCMTRLRFTLVDQSKADKNKIKNIDGVMGYQIVGNQHQVIIGPAIEKAFSEVSNLLKGKVDINTAIVEVANKKWGFKQGIDALTAILAPVIPAFCAAGMLKVILLMFTSFHWATGEEGTYILLNMFADVGFYFLPVLIAVSAGKRFKVDMALSAIIGASLIYPDFVTMVANKTPITFIGLNVPLHKYSSTIFPALLGVWLLSYVYKWIDKLVKWDPIKAVLVPMLSILITCPITLLCLAPIADTLAAYLTSAFGWLMATAGPIAGLVIGFFMPFMTLTGLHRSLGPLELMEITTFGYSQCLSIELYHNFAEAGSALGTAFFTKDKNLKHLGTETGVTAFIGVSEPALYGVMVKEKASMLAAMIGNGIGGCMGILLGIKGYAYVWPNVFSIPTFVGEKVAFGFVAVLSTIAVTFITSFVLVPVLNKAISMKKG